MKKSELGQIIKEEIFRMQKLAGIITESEYRERVSELEKIGRAHV